MICFYEFDTLLVEDDQLMNIYRWQWAPLAETPPRNCSTDELSDEDACSLTRLISVFLHNLYLFHKTISFK
jgi:hypothetical protein